MENVNSNQILGICNGIRVRWFSIPEKAAPVKIKSSKYLGKWHCEGALEGYGLIL